jgi:hypothetical protein
VIDQTYTQIGQAHTQLKIETPPASDPLTLKKILGICSLVFLLTTIGAVTALAPLNMPLRLGVPIACVTVFFAFAWLFSHQNPDASARRRGGLFLIFSGNLFLSKVVAFRSLELSVGDFVARCGINANNHWAVDLIVDVLCIVAALTMMLIGAWLLKSPLSRILMQINREDTWKEKAEEINTIDDELAQASEVKPVVFWERVRQLFHAKSFGGYTLGELNEDGCCVGTYNDDLCEQLVVTRCDDGLEPVSKESLEKFLRFCSRFTMTHAEMPRRLFYVVDERTRLSEDMIQSFPEVIFKSEEDLINEVVDFAPYLRELVRDYEKVAIPYSLRDNPLPLAATYVAPNFLVNGTAPKDVDLDAFINSWLERRTPEQLALLSDYGMGKSSYLLHLASGLATRCLAGEREVRIPILLRLTGLSPRNDPSSKGLISGFLNAYRLRCTLDAFWLLMKCGRLVFLIDGIDEMDLVGDETARRAHLSELWKLAVGENKLVFVGRPGYFATKVERERALRLSRQPSAELIGRVFCTEISLQPFTDAQIREAFSSYFSRAETSKQFEYLTRIIHQPQKWTRASAFDVRITLRATASQEHLAPQTSPSGCPDSAQMGRTVAIGDTSASQPAWAYNERVALEPLTLSMELKGSARSAARTPTRLNCASIPAPPGTTRVTKS